MIYERIRDKEFVKNFCELIELGRTIHGASKALGASATRIKEAYERGQEEVESDIETTYEAEFYIAVQEADHKFQRKNIILLENAAKEPKNWKAAAWLLEHCRPDTYGEHKDKDNDGDGTKKIIVEYVDPNTKEQKDRVAKMEEEIINEG